MELAIERHQERHKSVRKTWGGIHAEQHLDLDAGTDFVVKFKLRLELDESEDIFTTYDGSLFLGPFAALDGDEELFKFSVKDLVKGSSVTVKTPEKAIIVETRVNSVCSELASALLLRRTFDRSNVVVLSTTNLET